MLRNLLRKDLRLNAKVVLGRIPLLLWMGFALSEPGLSFATSGGLDGALPARCRRASSAAREDKFKALAAPAQPARDAPRRRPGAVRGSVDRRRGVLRHRVGHGAVAAVVGALGGRLAQPKVILFSLSCSSPRPVMLPFALRFGMVGVLVLMGALQFGGIVLLFWAEMSGRRGMRPRRVRRCRAAA